jgi:hypothetical protein
VRDVHELSAAIEGVDVVMTLPIQQERLESAVIPNTREYSLQLGAAWKWGSGYLDERPCVGCSPRRRVRMQPAFARCVPPSQAGRSALVSRIGRASTAACGERRPPLAIVSV